MSTQRLLVRRIRGRGRRDGEWCVHRRDGVQGFNHRHRDALRGHVRGHNRNRATVGRPCRVGARQRARRQRRVIDLRRVAGRRIADADGRDAELFAHMEKEYFCIPTILRGLIMQVSLEAIAQELKALKQADLVDGYFNIKEAMQSAFNLSQAEADNLFGVSNDKGKIEAA